jgi:hypothetical protein
MNGYQDHHECYCSRNMDITKAIAELRVERELVDQAILTLSRIAVRTRRRGRPPAWLADLSSSRGDDAADLDAAKPPSRRKGMSASAREAASERMRKYWAERRRKKK